MMNPDFPEDTGDLDEDRRRRRQFLTRLAATVAGSGVLSALPWIAPLRAAPLGSAASDRVRLGVIGVGSRGRRLMRDLLRTPGVELVALCDNYAPHLRLGMQAAGDKPLAFSDHRALLNTPHLDGVVIATPLHQHAPMCLDALAADKHVFCEKSLALTIDECRAVARAAGASKRAFQIGHQRLFSNQFLQAHQMVREGAIGDISQIRAYWHRNASWRNPAASAELDRILNWRLYRAYSAGLMGELASHHLHVANWFLDAAPLSCVGYGSINHWKDGREVHDNVNVVYRYRDGVSVVYDSLSSNRFHGMEVQIMGTKGTIEGESAKAYFEQAQPAPGIAKLVTQLEQGRFDTVAVAAPTWNPELKQSAQGLALRRNANGDDGTAVSLAAFANTIRSGQKIPQMVEHAYRAGVASLMGLAAVEQGGEILWPGNYE